jgi:hypothetical protein
MSRAGWPWARRRKGCCRVYLGPAPNARWRGLGLTQNQRHQDTNNFLKIVPLCFLEKVNEAIFRRSFTLDFSGQPLVGAVLSFLQPGNWLIGWLAFSFLFSFFWLFTRLHRWAGGGRALAWMIALAFALRLLTGVGVYLALPVDGYEDADDRAGFIFHGCPPPR